ncbi:MAG: hypothetical protein HQL56_02955 [Magnetococcales bacterium]|nr:hypothetical protein [Magnetococcales bacterium]
MNDPGNNHRIWGDIACQRALDAEALCKAGRFTGAVYMAGYVLETRLKQYCAFWDKDFPSSGPAGHDLRGLWKTAGFSTSSFQSAPEAFGFFMNKWSTGLRYSPDNGSSCQDMVDGAKRISGIIAGKCKRASRG